MTVPVVPQQDDPFEAYRRKHGIKPDSLPDDDFAAYRAKYQPPSDEGFRGAGSGGPILEPIGDAEGMLRAGGQGLTLGFSDELAGAGAALMPGGQGYKEARDLEREKAKQYESEHPWKAGLAEALGSLPTALAGGPASMLRGGMVYGAASGFGHAKGDVASQAKATGLGAALGGLFAGAAKLGGKVVGAGLDKLNPKRVVRREMATLMPEDAAATFAKREALYPKGSKANVPGELTKKTASVAKQLPKNKQVAITEPVNANQRIKDIKVAKKVVGTEYDALDRPLPGDPVIEQLADAAGRPLANPAMTSFAEVHRLRHEVSKLKAAGMARHDIAELREKISDWLSARVPEVIPIDAKYNELGKHLGVALRSLGQSDQGAELAAGRALSAGTREGNRLLGIPSLLHRILEPSPSRKAEALQKVAFTPGKGAGKELSKIMGERQNIKQNPNPFLGRAGASQIAALAAPQLSSDSASAHMQGIQMRGMGLTDAQMQQQLGAIYTPSIVRWILASTPQRLPQ